MDGIIAGKFKVLPVYQICRGFLHGGRISHERTVIHYQIQRIRNRSLGEHEIPDITEIRKKVDGKRTEQFVLVRPEYRLGSFAVHIAYLLTVNIYMERIADNGQAVFIRKD